MPRYRDWRAPISDSARPSYPFQAALHAHSRKACRHLREVICHLTEEFRVTLGLAEGRVHCDDDCVDRLRRLPQQRAEVRGLIEIFVGEEKIVSQNTAWEKSLRDEWKRRIIISRKTALPEKQGERGPRGERQTQQQKRVRAEKHSGIIVRHKTLGDGEDQRMLWLPIVTGSAENSSVHDIGRNFPVVAGRAGRE